MKELVQIHNEQINKIMNFKKYQEIKENPNLLKQKKYKEWLNGHGLSHIHFNERIKDKEWLKGWILDEQHEGFTNISGVNNHPHNTYLQLLCETGLVGFLCILSLWIFCIFKISSNIHLYYKCIFLGVIINLFPFIPTGNFFNNWLSILYFYPLGFLMYHKN